MKDLLQALANFQQEVKPIYKDKKGFGYKYASLSEILEQITPVLKKCSLGFYHLMEDERTLKTVVFHTQSDQQIESKSVLPVGNIKGNTNPAQDLGASITYFRRYHLSAMLGLITEDDTDAVPPSEKQQAPQQVPQQKKVIPQVPAQKKELKIFDNQKGEYTPAWANIISKRKELSFEQIKNAYTMTPEVEQKLKELLNA